MEEYGRGAWPCSSHDASFSGSGGGWDKQLHGGEFSDNSVIEYEQRFRIDRTKLETMLTRNPEETMKFFERIGADTETCVFWPSKLKIGSKSKKDPYVRVGGREEGVKRARALITEVLDVTASSRITMKLDVSFTDHSHIIGKGGSTIRKVMADTDCHIHFPDSNRSNISEKSNQVSIAGESQGVERARESIRKLSPLIFSFELPAGLQAQRVINIS